jgi:hypothetical protein
MKPKLVAALREVFDAESDLAAEHRKVGERHAADHDVFHICTTLAEQCDERRGRIRAVAAAAGEPLPQPDRHPTGHSWIAAIRRAAAEATGRTDIVAPMLLDDLRQLFLFAADCEIAWTIVGQGAKAAREQEVVALFSECCEEVTGQMRWVKTKIKLAAPQAVTSA